MVAARLGKRANRGGFVNSFWWSPAGQDGPGGMRDVLTALEAEPVDWPAAVAAFTAAADAVRALAAERQEAATAIERLATRGSGTQTGLGGNPGRRADLP